jgi:predicted O-methyltransferase YrrM
VHDAIWAAVDRYLAATVVGSDAVLDEALRLSKEAGLPQIAVSPAQGKLLQIIALATGARRILEIGTLGGYSTIWLGRALPPGGTLVTIEVEPAHAEVAWANLERAGLTEVVHLRLGPALQVLPQLEAEQADPFDMVFIDADKPSNPEYLSWAFRLTRPGSTIIVDNVVRDGSVLDESGTDAAVIGTRTMLQTMGSDPRLSATAIQTVGVKGYDGLAIAVVRGAP